MPTGQAAEQAAQNRTSKPEKPDNDRGPGSLAGNITRDPDLRYTDTGRAVTNMRVAVSERVKDKKTGEWKDGETAFYEVTCWGNLAENVVNHLAKGDRICAEGRWTSVTWTDNDGQVQEKIVLTARDLGPSMMFRGAVVQRTDKNQGR